MFGRSAIDLVGSPFGHPLVAGRCTEVEVLARGRAPTVVEMRVVSAQWEGRASRLACLRDVTDRKRAEEAARKLIRAQAERTAAQLASRRFQFLAEAGATLASSLDYRLTLSSLARLCVTELADWAVVYVMEDGDELRRLEVVHRDPGRTDAARRLREQPLTAADAAPLFEVMRTAKPFLATSIQSQDLAALSPDPERQSLLRELGLSSLMLLPMTARDRHVGALALASADPEQPFTDEDLALAQSLATRAALAVDNAQLYAEAQAADRAKSDLIAVISHDLRTPLNSIIGYADLLDLGVRGRLSDESRDWVRRIRGSAEHQVHLID